MYEFSKPSKVCHFLVSDIGGGESKQKMAKCGMGERGRGRKSQFLERHTFCMVPQVGG